MSFFKKFSKFLPAVFGIFAVAFSCLLFSCDEIAEEEPKKPDVEIQGNGISISIAFDPSAKYINIFRKKILPESATEEEIEENEVLNIGEIIPKDTSNINSYTFTDTLLVADTKYTYCLRYKHERGFVYTGWSEWPVDKDEEDLTPPDSDFASDAKLKLVKPENAFFEYSESSKSLIYKGDNLLDLDAFADFEPSLCLSYLKEDKSAVKRIFSIKDLCSYEETLVDEDGDGTPETTRKILLAEDNKIDLRSLMTMDFFDKDIYVDGIIYQKTDSTKPSYDKITWSQLVAFDVQDEEENELETIKIEYNANADDSHDFSNYDGSRMLEVEM